MPKTSTDVTIREATLHDLPVIAAIHKRAYSSDHFTALLSEATLEAYYGHFLTADTAIDLATRSTSTGHSTAGFCVHGIRIPEKIAAFKKSARGPIFATMIRNPVVAATKVLAAARAKLSASQDDDYAPYLLLSIATTEKAKGVGRSLLQAVEERARERGHPSVGLFVNKSNLTAINAYCRAGYRFKALQQDQYYMEKELG